MINDTITLGEISFVTKLAGFEHTKYIQHNATHEVNDVPLVIGKNVKDGKVRYVFDWYIPIEISDALPRSVLDKQCLVIPYVGSKLGELAVFRNDFKCHLGSNVAKVELLDDTLDIHYLYYYLSSKYGQLQLFKGKQGSAQPNITMTSIRETVVVKFEKSIQKQIAKVLSDLDAKIEVNNKINQELEAMAKTLYDYWFVQFDFPDANGKPYKSSGGKMVFNEVLKREIPEGWDVKELEFCADFKNGKGMKKNLLDDNGEFPVFGSNGIVGKTDKFLFDKPVIAIGRVGANYGEVHYSIDSCWITDNAVTSQPKKNEYLWWLLLALKGINYSKIAGGSAQPLITQGKLKALNFAIPSSDLFQNFHQIINPIYIKINNVLKQNQKLSELRDWLLPMLMNGQVRIAHSHADGNLGEVEQELGMVAEGNESYKTK
ncbi:restriction endonuclease subunit S [Winogradskyella eckloniae]|uniref:restriction endonuclease subunit S n=1 Tax=Winogradskyella eckloniae TaxID=1089306 RepID=UPI001565DB27|nr:restriction endonuclease subunit S [Winogradskyella eckloniae]NRD19516.1 restriction endonuclease subunit S [Winogradskyella eckloniae]